MRKKILIIVTHSTDNQERANAAVSLAVSLLSEEADLAMFFIFEGALMAKKGVAETIQGGTFTPVSELFPAIITEKIPLFLCSSCAKKYHITDEDLIPGAEIVSMSTLAGEMMTRETLTF